MATSIESASAGAQLPLPAAWAINSSPLNPQDRLDSLRRDKIEARARIGEVLDWLVDRHRADVMLPASTLTNAVDAAVSYVDDMISDATDRIESELEREIEEETDRLDKRGLW
jgi:hypothetical protein